MPLVDDDHKMWSRKGWVVNNNRSAVVNSSDAVVLASSIHIFASFCTCEFAYAYDGNLLS